MKAGFYQTHPVFGETKLNVDRVLRRLNRLKRGEADLIVLPELFNTGYQFISRKETRDLSEDVSQGYTVRMLSEAAGDLGLWLVAGLAERKGPSLYNSAALIGPRGLRSVYRKIHLFDEEKRWFSPGRAPFPVETIRLQNGTRVRIGMMICFDWIFPESARSLALSGAEVIAHPSNLVLPFCPEAMVTRCIENRVFSITANRVGSEKRGGKKKLTYIGRSEIVGPDGRIFLRAPGSRSSLGIVKLNPQKARLKKITPYNHLFRDRKTDLYRLG